MDAAAGRGRRVLRRADPVGRQRGRGNGDAAGVRRDAVVQAAVLLRRRPVAGRRPGAARAAGQPAVRPQQPLAQLRRVRHHVDAGQVGVPVVRRLGPVVPLRRARARRSGLRQVPADPAVPGVVPASRRRAACLRMGLRRREPARAGLGGARGLRRRWRPRPAFPQPDLRQAAGQLHLVGEQGRRRGQQLVRGRLPRLGQHRPDRQITPAGRRHPRAGRRDRLDGFLRARDGIDGSDLASHRPPARHRPDAQVRRALRRDQAGAERTGGSTTRPTGCTTTG